MSSNRMRDPEKDFFRRHKKRNSKPYFAWNNLPPTERLDFELLSTSNYGRVLELFQEDTSSFVQEDYKTLAALEEYVDYQLNYAYYSPKRGGCDWLFKLKNNHQYIGILNLYELSKETFADNHKKCMIGYCTVEEQRRKGYTKEAVSNLIDYAFGDLNIEKIIAKTEKENYGSKAFLAALNFREEIEKYYYSELFDFFELVRSSEK